MGANEARQVLAMTRDLGDVLALELYTAAQALDYRSDMLDAARRLAGEGAGPALARKIDNPPAAGDPLRAQFDAEVAQLAEQLSRADAFRPGAAVAAAHARLRQSIAFLHRDRALQHDIAAVCAMVRERVFTT